MKSWLVPFADNVLLVLGLVLLVNFRRKFENRRRVCEDLRAAFNAQLLCNPHKWSFTVRESSKAAVEDMK